MTSVKKEENAVKSFDNSDKAEDNETKAFYRKKKTKNKPKKQVSKKKVLLYLMTVTLIAAVFSSFLFLKTGKKNLWIPHLKWFPIQNSKSIKLEPFIIPFRGNGRYTYISLSISFEMPNKELMEEMIEKNNWIRGIIYNILCNNIHVLKNVSSLVKLKMFIIKGVNKVLTAGKVDKAIITDFSTI